MNYSGVFSRSLGILFSYYQLRVQNVTRVFLTLIIMLAAAFAEGSEEQSDSPPELGSLPVFYKGRIRPLDSCARLWMNEVYHRETLLPEHKKLLQFSQDAPVDFLRFLQSSSSSAIAALPFFWIEEEEIKSLLELKHDSERFSFEELRYAVEDVLAINLKVIEQMILSSFFKISRGTTLFKGQKLHLKVINADIECLFFDHQLVVTSAPTLIPWHFLSSLCCKRPYTIDLSQFQSAPCGTSLQALFFHFLQFKELRNSHSLLNTLFRSPFSQEFVDHSSPGISEISSLYDSLFLPSGIHLSAILPQFFFRYHAALREGLLSYPTFFQLKVEESFFKYPVLRASSAFYGLSLLCFFAYSMRRFRRKFGRSKSLLVRGIAWGSLAAGFLLHGGALLYKAVLFFNPSLSTLFDSVLLIAWLSVLIGFVFFAVFRSKFPIFAALICTQTLFLFLLGLNVRDPFAPVDPMLSPGFWLTVRGAMVTASYGMFILGGILGHLFLIGFYRPRQKTSTLLSRCIVHCIYLGTFFLVIGTLVGVLCCDFGWGYYKDWDPGESCTFISICFYLTLIHLNHFKWVSPFAAAVGACCGIVVLCLTWYSMNFLLRVGPHAHEKGSELIYLVLLGFEIAFITAIMIQRKRFLASLQKNSNISVGS